MGIASLFSIWSIEKEYQRGQLKLNALRITYENLSEAQIGVKGMQQNLNAIFLIKEDKSLKVKYKSAFERNVSRLEESLSEIDTHTFTAHHEDINSLKKEFKILVDSYRDLISKFPSKSLGVSQDYQGMSSNQENKLIILRKMISEDFIQTELNVKAQFDKRYHQLKQLLNVTILIAPCLAFINLFKALKVSSE